MSCNTRTNAYRSSNSENPIYNEVTRPRLDTKQYNDNTNTYNVITPYVKGSKSKSTNTRSSKKSMK